MLPNKVVARFKDGNILKGTTRDLSPNRRFFHLQLVDGGEVKIDLETLKIAEVDSEELKAAFFVKNFMGNKDYEDTYGDNVPGAGKKVRVTFFDNEVIVGFAMSYHPERHGFFMVPADLSCNNERIFIVKSATLSIEFI